MAGTKFSMNNTDFALFLTQSYFTSEDFEYSAVARKTILQRTVHLFVW